MSTEITLEQIKALNADYLRDLDLSDPSSLIFNFYGVEGEQAQELYQTATDTQAHLFNGIESLYQLLYQSVTNTDKCTQDKIEDIVLVLSCLTNLLKGVSFATTQLACEVKSLSIGDASK